MKIQSEPNGIRSVTVTEYGLRMDCNYSADAGPGLSRGHGLHCFRVILCLGCLNHLKFVPSHSPKICTRAAHGGKAGHGWLFSARRSADDPDWAEFQC